MPNEPGAPDFDSVGAWAKKFFYASRDLLETTLRPFDLGHMQWTVLYRLVHRGPLDQRDLAIELEIERATLSGILAALVRKGLIEQLPHETDQRQKAIVITDAGRELFAQIPDLIDLLRRVAFAGVDRKDFETAQRVLVDATERLNNFKQESTKS